MRSAFKGLLPALMSSVPAGIAVRTTVQTWFHYLSSQNITIYEWAKKQSLKKEYQCQDTNS